MVHNKHGTEEWVLDESSIFAHVDAFIQRCKDLLEVVEGQVRRGEGQETRTGEGVRKEGGRRGWRRKDVREGEELNGEFSYYLTSI